MALQIFHQLDPDTLERRDFMLAQIAATNCVQTKTTDLMPYYKPEPVDQKVIGEKVLYVFGGIAAAFDAKEKARG